MEDEYLKDAEYLFEKGELSGLDLFAVQRKVHIAKFTVECDECGHTWEINMYDYYSANDIPSWRFQCEECGYPKE